MGVGGAGESGGGKVETTVLEQLKKKQKEKKAEIREHCCSARPGTV